MAKNQKKSVPLPTREQLIQFVNDSPGNVGKREIARAFHLDIEQKRELKKLLRELTLEGSLNRGRSQKYLGIEHLPKVAVLTIIKMDAHGELLALPMKWPEGVSPPQIYMVPERRGRPALAIGDRVLAQLSKLDDYEYKAKTIRRLATAPAKFLGLFKRSGDSGRLFSTDKRYKNEFSIPVGSDMGARHGELVRAEVTNGKHLGLRQAKVIECLGIKDGPRCMSAIAIHDNEIPDNFSPESLKAAGAAKEASFEGRCDLRDIPLVTIDGADAKDFDDAVWAEPDTATDNIGGWHLLVAIADVAWYVRPGGPLDRDAKQRGNSIYFPDRVVPMLPESLSNGLCSLRPGENRPCIAVHMWIDSSGKLIRYEFVRGIMRSAARLTYEQVQSAWEGNPDTQTKGLFEPVILPLYGAFQALREAREKRGSLELDLPERKIELADDGNVVAIRKQQQLDSNRLIEEFMVTANVAAAENLEKLGQPCIYRIHDRPSDEKTKALNKFLETFNLQFPRSHTIKSKSLNRILQKVASKPEADMVSQIILRSQAQAEYSPDNIGHFGLALQRYTHFTSPIRRYSDLVVHRSLVQGLKLGDGGLSNNDKDFKTLANHISMTERRASKAERETADRLTALFLKDHINSEFQGRINGINKAGLFVTLVETGADGLVPMRTLPNDYYDHDSSLNTLIGSRNKLVFRLGQELQVRLDEAFPLTGGLILSIVGYENLNTGLVLASKGKRRSRKRIRKKNVSSGRRR